ncbi:MAG: GTPase Era [Steroidobacteraceae bacterium]|nr:GTPase Era [Steroidobacteraceae bacterium]MDW8258114.1 GTPase Era [Gammaproteobacteria bacterium]
MRAGFAALSGRPNVGKSTLLNTLVGSKISIVTPRPQTTRHRVLGIVHHSAAQIAFVDTPGLQRTHRRALNRAMNRMAVAAMGDADVVVLVLEAGRFTPEDEYALQRARAARRPIIAVVNKIDRVRPRTRLLPQLQELHGRAPFAAIVPISALRRENLTALLDAIVAQLPQSPSLFDSDMLTDRDLRFRVAETVREKLTLHLHQEVPYGIATQVESLGERGQQRVASVAIWVDRPGHKAIVIGRQGERLKAIGRAARRELNRLTGARWHLDLWVKVRAGWADEIQALRSLGLE